MILLLLTLAACAPDPWKVGHEACGDGLDATCAGVLEEHFPGSLAGADQEAFLAGAYRLATWDLGPAPLVDVEDDGEGGPAGAVYRLAVESFALTKPSGTSGFFTYDNGVLWVGEGALLLSPESYGTNLAHEASHGGPYPGPHGVCVDGLPGDTSWRSPYGLQATTGYLAGEHDRTGAADAFIRAGDAAALRVCEE